MFSGFNKKKKNIHVFAERYEGNEACFSLRAAVIQTCSAPCPPLTCTCSLMSWRRKKRWRGGPLLPSVGQLLPLLPCLTVTSPQPLSPPHPRRRCSRCSRMPQTAMNAGTAAWCQAVCKNKVAEKEHSAAEKKKKILKKCIYSLKPHKETWFTLHLKFMAVFLIEPIKLHVYRLYIVCTVGHFSKAYLRF